MLKGAYISYLRVSTVRQGRSGLGLEAQRQAVAGYVGAGADMIVEVIETESGRNSDRPLLAQALKLARIHRVPVIVAKVDRLTRSLAFLTALLESGVDVRFADLPMIEGPTGRFMLTQMASVAELEAGLISARTKAALAAKADFYTKLTRDERQALLDAGKAVSLGGNRGAVISAEASAAGRAARSKKSAARAADLAPVIAELKAAGVKSLGAIAQALMDRRIPTATGGAVWTRAGVSRVTGT